MILRSLSCRQSTGLAPMDGFAAQSRTQTSRPGGVEMFRRHYPTLGPVNDHIDIVAVNSVIRRHPLAVARLPLGGGSRDA